MQFYDMNIKIQLPLQFTYHSLIVKLSLEIP